MAKVKPKILVAMSGGVDSSVAAALLVEQGYDVVGAFMVNYNPQSTKSGESGMGECWSDDYRDALRVAARLGISLIRLDFTRAYECDVLRYLYKEYRAGRTPNPDVLCNQFVKFGAWLTRAQALGFDYLATGHYARLARRAGKIKLLAARDSNKDQTYFLHRLSQEQLRRVMFPVGNYTKPQIRKRAEKLKLPTAHKEESMGICFVGEVPMRKFLQQKIKPRPGKMVSSEGEELGIHEGLAFYTIGERVAPARSHGAALYVVDKDFKKNILVVGKNNDSMLFKTEVAIENVSWTSGLPPRLPLRLQARLRHRQPLQKCSLSKSNSVLKIKFVQPQRAVTPGQFAVFYQAGECLGGGVIK